MDEEAALRPNLAGIMRDRNNREAGFAGQYGAANPIPATTTRRHPRSFRENRHVAAALEAIPALGNDLPNGFTAGSAIDSDGLQKGESPTKEGEAQELAFHHPALRMEPSRQCEGFPRALVLGGYDRAFRRYVALPLDIQPHAAAEAKPA